MKRIFMLILVLCFPVRGYEVAPAVAGPSIITTQSIIIDYRRVLDIINKPERDRNELLPELFYMLDRRGYIDCETLQCMHSLIPESYKTVVYGAYGEGAGVFDIFGVATNQQQIGYAYEGESFEIFTLAECCEWEFDRLKRFIDDNYRALIYQVTCLNHLNRKSLVLDEDELSEVINNQGINREVLRAVAVKVSTDACRYRRNFNANIWNNLSIFGIPEDMWSASINSRLLLGTRDWFDNMSQDLVETSQRLILENSDISDIPDHKLLYCYFIFQYRVKAAFSMSATVLDHIGELYAEQFREAVAQNQRPVEVLASLQKRLEQLQKELTAKQKKLTKAERSKESSLKIREKTQKELTSQEKKVRELQTKINSIILSLAQLEQKKSNDQDQLLQITQESEAVFQQVNRLSKEVMMYFHDIKRLEAREDHRGEYDEVLSSLAVVQNQWNQLQGIYKIFAQNSGGEKLRLENEQLKAGNAALDAEIARLEAELAGD